MADSVLKKGDPYSKTPNTIGTIPLGTSIVHTTSATVNAGSSLTFIINSYPIYPAITLWNFLMTIFVDGVDDAHEFPIGSSVLSISHLISVGTWIDVIGSGQISGRRQMRIHIINRDTNPHDITIYFKAFLQTGLSSGDIS